MADVKWIKITTDIFDDEKILIIESMPSADSIIVIWFKLLTLAGKQNNNGVFLMSNRIAYTEEMLASIFRRDLNTVRLALKTFEQFGMIEIIENVITIPNWNKHQSLDSYEKKKERDKLYMRERRAAQRALVEKSSDESSDSKTTGSSYVVVSEEDKEKEIDKDIDKDKKSVRETTLTLFNRLSSDYIFDTDSHATLRSKMEEWCRYKMERKEPYKEQGMKSLLRKVENNALTHGDADVCELIEECMANNWKGIIFDRLEKQPVKSSKPAKQSYQPQHREPTSAEMAMETERLQRFLESMR
jgi:predicted phage replisome organizer